MANQITTLGMGQKFKRTPAGEIPVDWGLPQLGDVAEIIMGQSPPSSACNQEGRGLPFYQGNADFGATNPSPTSWCTEPTKRAKVGDILISVRAPVGELNISNHECCIGRGLSAIRAKKTEPKFLYYTLQAIGSLLTSRAQGSTFDAINGKELAELPIPMPLLHEQKKIAAILSSVDDAIERTRAVIEKAKQLKKGLMQTLLTRGIGHKKIKKTSMGEVPTDWEITTFGKAFNFFRTANNSRAELAAVNGVGYLHYGDLHTKWRTALDCESVGLPQIDNSKVKNITRLEDGDLVMADASEDYEGLGVSVEASNVGNRQIVAGLHTFLLRDKGNNFADGFRGYIQYIPIVRKHLVKVATGVSVFGFSKGNLFGIPIPRPPLDEQKKIAAILAAMDTEIGKEESACKMLQGQKKALMQNLLSGRARISR